MVAWYLIYMTTKRTTATVTFRGRTGRPLLRVRVTRTTPQEQQGNWTPEKRAEMARLLDRI